MTGGGVTNVQQASQCIAANIGRRSSMHACSGAEGWTLGGVHSADLSTSGRGLSNIGPRHAAAIMQVWEAGWGFMDVELAQTYGWCRHFQRYVSGLALVEAAPKTLGPKVCFDCEMSQKTASPAARVARDLTSASCGPSGRQAT